MIVSRILIVQLLQFASTTDVLILAKFLKPAEQTPFVLLEPMQLLVDAHHILGEILMSFVSTLNVLPVMIVLTTRLALITTASILVLYLTFVGREQIAWLWGMLDFVAANLEVLVIRFWDAFLFNIALLTVSVLREQNATVEFVHVRIFISLFRTKTNE